jgi:hypothetical protein
MSKISFEKLSSLLKSKGFELLNVYCIETRVIFVECCTDTYQQKFFIFVSEKYLMNIEDKKVKTMQIREISSKTELIETMKHLRDVFDNDIKLIVLSCFSLTMFDPISNSLKSWSFKTSTNKNSIQEESDSGTKVQLLKKEFESLDNDEDEVSEDEENDDDIVFENAEETEIEKDIIIPKTATVKLSNIVFGVIFISFTISDFLQSNVIDEKYIIECQTLLTDNLKDIIVNRAKTVEQKISQTAQNVKSKTDKNCEKIKSLNLSLTNLGTLLTKSINAKQTTQKDSTKAKLDSLITQLKREIKITSDEMYKIQDLQDELLSNSEYLIEEFGRHFIS